MIGSVLSMMRCAGFLFMKSRCRSHTFVLFCAISIFALPAVAVTGASETFVLTKPTLKAGDVRRLVRTVTTLDVQSRVPKHKEVVKIVEKWSSTVKSLKPDGSATLVFKMEVSQMFKDGKKVPSNLPPVVTLFRSPEGKMTVVAKGKTTEGDADIGTEIHEPLALAESLYPEKAISVGDHWPITYSMGTSEGLGHAELTGTKQIAGVKALNIKFTAEVNVEKTREKFHVEGVFTVNATTNEILTYETTDAMNTREQTLTRHIVLLALGKDPKDDPK
jgi:hypothetical protein